MATPLPDVQFAVLVTYTHAEHAPLALVVTASVSLCAVTAILVAMAISGFKTRHQFIRSQVGAYFLSLVLSDLLQAAGSVMNARWVAIQGVNAGPFCTTQAALKQIGNVGTALWSLVIAIHTFCLLFLRLRIGDRVFYTILVGTWLFLAFIVMMGPLIIQNPKHGPFWGISGYWCWITGEYYVEQITNEYLFMFLTAGTSFALYSLIFFRLRGNIQGFGWKLKFRRAKQPWAEDSNDESNMSAAGKQMLWYPVAYSIIISPIAVCRLHSIFGHEVPHWATIFADSIFMLSGFVNAILYSTTRKIVSVRSFPPLSYFFVHLRPSRGDGPVSKPYLDDMKFADPLSPHSTAEKFGTRQSSMISVPGRIWRSRSETFTVHTRDSHLSPRELARIENADEVKSRRIPEGPTEDGPPLEIVVAQPPTSTDTGRLRSFLPSLGSSPSRERLPDPSKEDLESLSRMRAASDASASTDGAPSLHHKRFSGWSLPSHRDAISQRSEGQESMRTELDEMQFAPPSPEPVRPKVLSPVMRSSFSDLQSLRWPARCPPME